MIASLPKLFNMIHFLFQSIKRSVITKEELIHKIIASHCDIVDRREVEEHLNLLIELVPEWISEKLASGGDLLFWQALLICDMVVDGSILIVIENKWIFKYLSLEDHKLFFKRQNLFKLFDVIICSFL